MSPRTLRINCRIFGIPGIPHFLKRPGRRRQGLDQARARPRPNLLGRLHVCGIRSVTASPRTVGSPTYVLFVGTVSPSVWSVTWLLSRLQRSSSPRTKGAASPRQKGIGRMARVLAPSPGRQNPKGGAPMCGSAASQGAVPGQGTKERRTAGNDRGPENQAASVSSRGPGVGRLSLFSLRANSGRKV